MPSESREERKKGKCLLRSPAWLLPGLNGVSAAPSATPLSETVRLRPSCLSGDLAKVAGASPSFQQPEQVVHTGHGKEVSLKM